MRVLRRTKDRGAAAVEFALVVMLLLVLVIGILNFGILFGQQLSLNNAVREGARSAVVEENKATNGTAAGIRTNVRNATGPLINNPATITVTTAGGGPGIVCADSLDAATGARDSITVTATYPASLLAPMPIPGFPGSFTLTAKAVYRCEFS